MAEGNVDDTMDLPLKSGLNNVEKGYNETVIEVEPEPPKSRSRLRLFAVLSALFVRMISSYLFLSPEVSEMC
jgi:hypothetical protein